MPTFMPHREPVRGSPIGMAITIEQLAKVFPSQTGEVLDMVLQQQTDAGLVEPRVAALFDGQLDHESEHLTALREHGEGYKHNDDGVLVKPGYWPYFGRGYIQLTWRRNYEAFAKFSGLDCVNHPELIELPENAMKAAIWFYKGNGLHLLKDVDSISRRINGAAITKQSLESRRACCARALRIFTAP
jgi:putative chitinase